MDIYKYIFDQEVDYTSTALMYRTLASDLKSCHVYYYIISVVYLYYCYYYWMCCRINEIYLSYESSPKNVKNRR